MLTISVLAGATARLAGWMTAHWPGKFLASEPGL